MNKSFVLLLLVTFALFTTSSLTEQRSKPKHLYLYLVGLEGVGHHGIRPILYSAARMQKKVVLMGDGTPLNENGFRVHMHLFHYEDEQRKFREFLADTIDRHSPSPIIFFEHESFPCSDNSRTLSIDKARYDEWYDLEWYYNAVEPAHDIDIKFLYLTRDDYHTIRSHDNWDGGFRQHGQTLKTFSDLIQLEYFSTNRLHPGMWRGIKFEWFQHLENCKPLLHAISTFLNWDITLVDDICAFVVPSLLKPTHTREFNQVEHDYAKSLNLTLPIPFFTFDPPLLE